MPVPEAISPCPSGATPGPHSSPGPTSQPWLLCPQEGACWWPWLPCSWLGVGWAQPWNPLPWSLNTGSPGWTSGAPCNRESVTRNLCLGNGTKPHVPHNRGVGAQLRSSAGAGSHQVDLNLGAVELFSACPCTQKGKEQTCLKSWQRLVFQRGLKLLEDKAWSSLGCLWCWHMLASRNKVLSCPQHLPF